MKSAREVRSSFLDFFHRNGHSIQRSSPLVPHNDPTLLFTNAGMVQFKDVFTGRETRDYNRATTSQKCVRAGGKHNDLENVGRTARHHTFFEMLGNFSFGDYFKEGAIEFAWNWLTKELGIDPQRMCVTVFGGDAGLKLGPDEEAEKIWRKITGYPADRIIRMGMKDNFWMMGDTGPQGPCSEIHYYIGDGPANLAKFNEEPGADGVGWMEIWNLVFMQFERKAKDAPLTPLPKPSIDTGAGLERVSAVVQNVRSNYDTDLLKSLVLMAGDLAKKKYTASASDDDVSMRVLADHARAATFLLGDNVTPSNEGRGYVLRRIMRRAIRHGVRLGLREGQFREICELVIAEMSAQYPELTEAKNLIVRSVDSEDQNFRRTLDRGLKLLDDAFSTLTPGHKVAGETVFKLYDTYGFPADLTRVIAEERGYSVDEAGFDREMDKQRARGDFAGSGEAAVADIFKELRTKHGASDFLGYESTEANANIIALVVGGKVVTSANAGDDVALIADKTPFYGESGGQVGDAGEVSGKDFAVDITDTSKPGGDFVVHLGKVKSGSIKVGDTAKFSVDARRRDAIRANHSATHLLHLALKEVVGNHVAQKGSLVAPERLRFDFSHSQPLTDDEKRRIEDIVNDEIRKNDDSVIEVKSFDDAKKSGAVALFGEKYGDKVRVMRIGSRSMELCGGTHVKRTGDIGLFKIITETGIAQGIRRIEAVTGAGAIDYIRKVEGELVKAAGLFRAGPFETAAKVERMQEDLKNARREVEDAKRKMAMGGGGGRDIMASVREIGGIKVLASRSDIADPKALREVADQLRGKLGSALVVLGGVENGKVSLVAAVSADLVERFSAGKLIAALAPMIGGKGGGRADFAQAGGTDASQLDAALEHVYTLVS